jgi:hypothetical protein
MSFQALTVTNATLALHEAQFNGHSDAGLQEVRMSFQALTVTNATLALHEAQFNGHSDAGLQEFLLPVHRMLVQRFEAAPGRILYTCSSTPNVTAAMTLVTLLPGPRRSINLLKVWMSFQALTGTNATSALYEPQFNGHSDAGPHEFLLHVRRTLLQRKCRVPRRLRPPLAEFFILAASHQM